jgi:hypothetical protein
VNYFWKLHAVISWVFSETVTSLWVSYASLVSKTKEYRSRWALVDLQKLNIMLQSCSSRCWVGWMWYRYKPSKFTACQIDVCGTPTHEETLLIFQCRVCFAMARMFLLCLWGCDNKGVKEDYKFLSDIYELPWYCIYQVLSCLGNTFRILHLLKFKHPYLCNCRKQGTF